MNYTYSQHPQRSQLPLPLALLPAIMLIFMLFAGAAVIRTMGRVAFDESGRVSDSNTSTGAATGPPASAPIAALFMPGVQYWAADIARWAAAYDLDPNLVATVMQIESCGDPSAISRAGAQGLFQVMPFHFSSGESMLDPNTNARRGMGYLARSLMLAQGNAGLAMAGYNGGHSVIGQASNTWAAETRRYFAWGSGIYSELQTDPVSSPTLMQWLAAGGNSLCQQAEHNLGLAADG